MTKTIRKTPAASNAASIDAIRRATADIPATAKVVNTKPAAKSKATVTGEPLEPGTESAYFEQFANMFEQFKIPSGRRMLVSVVMNFLTAGLTMYVGFSITGMLLLGAAALTTSAFIGFMVSFMGFALSLYAGIILGAKVGKYIALGQIDDDAKRARAWISNKWNSVKERFSSDDDQLASA